MPPNIAHHILTTNVLYRIHKRDFAFCGSMILFLIFGGEACKRGASSIMMRDARRWKLYCVPHHYMEYNIMPHLSPPIPVTIVVRNFFPPQVAASSSSSSLHNTTSTTVSDVTNSSKFVVEFSRVVCSHS